MNKLSKLLNKKSLNVLGLMSGTSIDGLDLALCKIARFGKQYKLKTLEQSYYKYPQKLKQNIIDIASSASFNQADLKQLDYKLAMFYSSRIIKFKQKYPSSRIDLIGSHGQTIYHRDHRLAGNKKNNSLTWQIGDGAYISKLTGIPVVSDFRMDDIAAGGSGAPLTPICNYHLLANQKQNIAVLNIGGIANLTYLPAHAKLFDIKASDCGPGNMLIDQLMMSFYDKKFDRNGKTALTGKLDSRLFNHLKRFKWYESKFPRSLGREQFGSEVLKKIINFSKKHRISFENIITTVSELTVQGVVVYLSKFPQPSEIVISGGGVYNKYFRKRLEEIYPESKIVSSSQYGIDPDYLEALSFALLAVLFLDNKPAGLSFVTGANKNTIMGKLSLP